MSRNETLVCFFPLNIYITNRLTDSHFVGSIWRTFSCLFYFIIWILSHGLLCLPVSSRQMSEYGTNLQREKRHHASMERCHKILSNSAVGSALWKEARSRIRSNINFRNVLYCFKVSGLVFFSFFAGVSYTQKNGGGVILNLFLMVSSFLGLSNLVWTCSF